MVCERKQYIPEEDEELRRIREKKLEELVKLKEKKLEMSGKPVQVTDSDFDVTVSKYSLALIDCWAPWCAPCKIIAPTIEELAGKYVGKVLVGKLNVDENPKTATRFRVFGIPTLLIMKDGKEADRIVGVVPKTELEARLEKFME